MPLPKLPSRYEDLDVAFRGRLRPVAGLIELVQQAYRSMLITGGIRFLPLFGKSGSGKTSAALELATHIPDAAVHTLSRAELESIETLTSTINTHFERLHEKKLLILVVDQFEEAVVNQSELSGAFIERLALLDRGELRKLPLLVVWLTTKREFQESLSNATSRNSRILLQRDFELTGPPKQDWVSIIEDTFSFHNNEAQLAELDVLQDNLAAICDSSQSLGDALSAVGALVGRDNPGLHDISQYQVVMLWPVTDGQRIGHFQRFTDARQGYRLDWGSWLRQLNPEDQRQLAHALHGFNKARLYFDLRVVPIAAADLKDISANLQDDQHPISRTALGKFQRTHFYYLVAGSWDPQTYSPMRERDSDRATEARDWYAGVTESPVLLGKRIARALRDCGIGAEHEQEIQTPFGTVRADLLVNRPSTAGLQPKVIVELKAFAAERTMPSAICEQIKVTLRRHAQLAGFLERQ